jgi:hypothetical protein
MGLGASTSRQSGEAEKVDGWTLGMKNTELALDIPKACRSCYNDAYSPETPVYV